MKRLHEKLVVVALALAAVAAWTAAAYAAEKHPAVEGTIVSVSGNDLVISTKKGDKASEVTVKTDENTRIKIDGKDAKLQDLKAGMHATVPAYEEVATQVLAHSTKGPESGGGLGGPGNPDLGPGREPGRGF